ncbi:MAG: FlgD immunoglobulin-like domain containing protein [Gaiellaceae bacterium]
MTFLRAAAIALAVVVLAPDTASAAVRLVARDEPVGSAGLPTRALPARPAPLEFDLVGLHWKGPGTVWFRTAPVAGSWSAWRPATAEAEDLPDPGTREASARGRWRLGSPYWTGRASRIQYRLAGDVRRLRAFFIRSDSDSARPAAAARAAQPAIVRRAQWGADESIVRSPPRYAPAVHFAVVHHTAGTNSYTASQSAAIVRGIQRYHVLANGWNDIGYNFLVDKYGQVFEGRGGGIDRNVVGAHAQGFNTGSTGVAVLGTYESRGLASTARAAFVKLLAWRLDVAHVDPLSRLTWTSGGSPKYPAGTRVALRAVSAHRDTGLTSCPGGSLYAQLPSLAASAAAEGLPKLYGPLVTGGLGGNVRFRATLSSALPWTVTVLDAGGAPVAGGSGAADAVDWTWDASEILFGNYTYTIEAGSDVLAASGAVPGPPLLAVSSLTVSPGTLTPNGDGVGETVQVSYSLTTTATVKVEILDLSSRVVRALVTGQAYRGGTPRLTWDGSTGSGAIANDGRFRVRVTAEAPGQQAVRTRALLVDRTLGHLGLAPTPFSPNGDGRLDAAKISFTLARQADVRVRIMKGTRKLAGVSPTKAMAAGRRTLTWNGRNQYGVVPDGTYTAKVEATGTLGTRVLSIPVRVDTRAPAVGLVSARRSSGRTVLRLRLSEPASVTLAYGSPFWWSGGVMTVERPAGLARLVIGEPAARVRVMASDAAGNRARPIVVRVRAG